MAPIRTALIGLSASAATAWASKAHLPYLLSTQGRARYEIVALLNSSVEAARAAIEHYGLPASTRAYGDPAALAADPDVDLVVCSTRVDRHAPTVRDVLRAGKAVFVEWPLAENAQVAGELLDLAREGGGRTLVGVQGRVSPIVLKVKELLEAGVVGKVLSVEVRAAGGTVDRAILPTGLRYFSDKAVGGNVFTIGFAHLIDTVQSAHGEIQNLKSHLQIQRPDIPIRDNATGTIVDTVKSNVPDLIIVAGTLPTTPTVAAGASFLMRYRRGQPFKDEPALVWTVNGEKGEVRVTGDGASLNAHFFTKPVLIEVHNHATDTVETVPWEWPSWQGDIPIPARNIGALYELFAEGRDSEYADFEKALGRHRQLDAILGVWD